jgi:hypothetical protein
MTFICLRAASSILAGEQTGLRLDEKSSRTGYHRAEHFTAAQGNPVDDARFAHGMRAAQRQCLSLSRLPLDLACSPADGLV